MTSDMMTGFLVGIQDAQVFPLQSLDLFHLLQMLKVPVIRLIVRLFPKAVSRIELSGTLYA